MIVTDCLLVAYADDELDPDTSQRVETLLEGAAEMRRKVEIFRETAALLRAACASDAAPTEAAGEVVPPMRPRRTAELPRARRFAWAIAASLVAGIAGFGGGTLCSGTLHSERAELIDEIADYHPIYSRESKHMVEVPAEASAELAAWAGRLLDRRVALPELAGLTFAGGRMLVVNGRPVAQLMYTREHGLPVALCLTRLAGEAAPIHVEKRGTLRLAQWQDGAYAYVVVGELDDGTARTLAESASRQL
jgi:anti-sigma factor RsiW